MKVLIAYDGSGCARDALAELKRAGLPERTEALMLCVAEPWHAPVGTGGMIADMSSLSDPETARHLAEEGRGMLAEHFSGWNVQAEGRKGSPSHQIIERAEEWGADLIVVGSHGLNAMERLVFGSVSQQIVTGAHCSVRVSRGNPHRDYEPVRLLIGVDASIDSNAAVESVLARNWPEHTKVWLVTGISSGFEGASQDQERDEYGELHNAIAARMKEKGLSTASVIEPLDPKHLILGTAKEIEADCIFMGSRGLTRFERTLLGSVSASITAHAGCSVEVVRKKAEANPEE